MKSKMVERKIPEDFIDCDQLRCLGNCGMCAYGDYAHSSLVFGKRKCFYAKGVQEGKLRVVIDSNGEERYEIRENVKSD